eukprot:3717117-Pleurochrysis_carterae.AAC.1
MRGGLADGSAGHAGGGLSAAEMVLRDREAELQHRLDSTGKLPREGAQREARMEAAEREAFIKRMVAAAAAERAAQASQL